MIEKDKKRIGFTCSTFDLLHAGHILMLEEAKAQCDILYVGLQVDPTLDRPEKNQPIQSIVERFIQLKGVKVVDEVYPYSTEKDLEDLLSALPIDVRILGEEYRDKDFTGRDICKKRGISLYFNRRDHRFSSSLLRKEVFEKENGKNK
jgi:glycerol-3-phosphate cytidylyltransferase